MFPLQWQQKHTNELKRNQMANAVCSVDQLNVCVSCPLCCVQRCFNWIWNVFGFRDFCVEKLHSTFKWLGLLACSATYRTCNSLHVLCFCLFLCNNLSIEMNVLESVIVAVLQICLRVWFIIEMNFLESVTVAGCCEFVCVYLSIEMNVLESVIVAGCCKLVWVYLSIEMNVLESVIVAVLQTCLRVWFCLLRWTFWSL